MEKLPSTTNVEVIFANNSVCTVPFNNVCHFTTLKNSIEDLMDMQETDNTDNIQSAKELHILSKKYTPKLFLQAIKLTNGADTHTSIYEIDPSLEKDNKLENLGALFDLAHEYDNQKLLTFLATSLMHMPIEHLADKDNRIKLYKLPANLAQDISTTLYNCIIPHLVQHHFLNTEPTDIELPLTLLSTLSYCPRLITADKDYAVFYNDFHPYQQTYKAHLFNIQYKADTNQLLFENDTHLEQIGNELFVADKTFMMKLLPNEKKFVKYDGISNPRYKIEKEKMLMASRNTPEKDILYLYNAQGKRIASIDTKCCIYDFCLNKEATRALAIVGTEKEKTALQEYILKPDAILPGTTLQVPQVPDMQLDKIALNSDGTKGVYTICKQKRKNNNKIDILYSDGNEFLTKTEGPLTGYYFFDLKKQSGSNNQNIEVQPISSQKKYCYGLSFSPDNKWIISLLTKAFQRAYPNDTYIQAIYVSDPTKIYEKKLKDVKPKECIGSGNIAVLNHSNCQVTYFSNNKLHQWPIIPPMEPERFSIPSLILIEKILQEKENAHRFFTMKLPTELKIVYKYFPSDIKNILDDKVALDNA